MGKKRRASKHKGSPNNMATRKRIPQNQSSKSKSVFKKVSYVGCIIVDAQASFLLQRRDEKNGISNPGVLSTFGGGIHSGESPQQALVRELNEELGLVVSTERPLFVGYCEKYDHIKHQVVASWYFGLALLPDETVDCKEGKLELIKPEVNLSILKNIGPVTLEMINRFANQHYYVPQPSPSSQIEPFALDRSSKLTVLSALLNYAIYEAQTYWHRTTLFLTINSVILGLIYWRKKTHCLLQ